MGGGCEDGGGVFCEDLQGREAVRKSVPLGVFAQQRRPLLSLCFQPIWAFYSSKFFPPTI